MIKIHYEIGNVLEFTVVAIEDKEWVCKDLLDKGYYLVGESDA